jgi:hypothetical protein
MLGVGEIAGGALMVLGVFSAFMLWAVFPLVPFAIIGVAYAAIRYGIPAVARSLVFAGQGVVEVARWALTPIAVWTLRGPEPAYQYGDGSRKR